MIVRKAKQTDVDVLRRMLTQLGYPNTGEADVLKKIAFYSREEYQLLVAETDHEVVGFIALHWLDVFHFPGRMGRMTAFCVEERYRGQGIGMLLLREAEEFFKHHGVTKIEVTSNNRRDLTHQFYLKRGYKEDSRRFVKYLGKSLDSH
jgi:ribosomal protein S18 acetylase RimI-like enzyme